jgi:cytoskeletal protein CcmA (bactofilin family)
MAWAWLDKKNSESSEWTGFLEKGVRLEGKLESSGTLRIDSAMKGTLVSEGVLILGEHAQVEGEIHPEAIVSAEVHTPCLVIEPGSVFDGECHMPQSGDAAKPVAIPIRSIAQAAPAASETKTA